MALEQQMALQLDQNASVQPQKPFRFMDLPAELRILVYRQLLRRPFSIHLVLHGLQPGDFSIQMSSNRGHAIPVGDVRRRWYLTPFHFCKSNKTIWLEMHRLLYSTIHIMFKSPDQLERFMLLHPNKVQEIRHVTVDTWYYSGLRPGIHQEKMLASQMVLNNFPKLEKLQVPIRMNYHRYYKYPARLWDMDIVQEIMQGGFRKGGKVLPFAFVKEPLQGTAVFVLDHPEEELEQEKQHPDYWKSKNHWIDARYNETVAKVPSRAARQG